MKTFFYILLLINSISVFSQSQNSSGAQRNGFIFETAFGGFLLQLNTTNLPSEIQYSISFPNFKIGAMVSDKIALAVYLPREIFP